MIPQPMVYSELRTQTYSGEQPSIFPNPGEVVVSVGFAVETTVNSSGNSPYSTYYNKYIVIFGKPTTMELAIKERENADLYTITTLQKEKEKMKEEIVQMKEEVNPKKITELENKSASLKKQIDQVNFDSACVFKFIDEQGLGEDFEMFKAQVDISEEVRATEVLKFEDDLPF